MLTVLSARGQTIVAPAIIDRMPTVSESNIRSQKPADAAPSSANSVLASDLPLLRAGFLTFRPHGSYRIQHQTGIEAAPGYHVNTDSQAVAPGSWVGIGDHWQGDYTATWTSYSNSVLKSSADQVSTVAGAYDFSVWSFALTGAYSSTHPILIETGGQNHELTYGGQAEAHIRINPRSQLNLNISESYRKTASLGGRPDLPLATIRDWSTHDTLALRVTDKTSVSAGATVGYTSPSIGPDMSYVTPQLHINWKPVEKITVDADAGVERRRIRGSNAMTLSSPVYLLSLRYDPSRTTSFVLTGTQGIATSYLGNTITRSVSVQAGLQQRLFGVALLTTSVAWQESKYIQTEASLPVMRGDRYTTYEARLGVPLLKRAEIAAFYQYTHNASTHAVYGFNGTEYGIEISVRF